MLVTVFMGVMGDTASPGGGVTGCDGGSPGRIYACRRAVMEGGRGTAIESMSRKVC